MRVSTVFVALNKAIFGLGVVTFLLAPLSAFAASNYCSMGQNCPAKVIYKGSSCIYYVAQDAYDNFYIFSWFGGKYPQVGNILYGKWNSAGATKDMVNMSYPNWPTTKIFPAGIQVQRSNLIKQFGVYCPNY